MEGISWRLCPEFGLTSNYARPEKLFMLDVI